MREFVLLAQTLLNQPNDADLRIKEHTMIVHIRLNRHHLILMLSSSFVVPSVCCLLVSYLVVRDLRTSGEQCARLVLADSLDEDRVPPARRLLPVHVARRAAAAQAGRADGRRPRGRRGAPRGRAAPGRGHSGRVHLRAARRDEPSAGAEASHQPVCGEQAARRLQSHVHRELACLLAPSDLVHQRDQGPVRSVHGQSADVSLLGQERGAHERHLRHLVRADRLALHGRERNSRDRHTHREHHYHSAVRAARRRLISDQVSKIALLFLILVYNSLTLFDVGCK